MNQKIKFAMILLTLCICNLHSLYAEEPNPAEKELNQSKSNLNAVTNSEESKAKEVEPAKELSAPVVKTKNTEKTTVKSNEAENSNAKLKKLANEKTVKPEKTDLPIKKESRSNKGPILKNQALSEEFRDSNLDENPMEQGVVNLFYGLVSGGLIGLGGGLSFYTTSTNTTPLFISAGALGAAGAITGIIITLIEKSSNNPLLGGALLEYSWYGALGGATLGGLIGIIPYSSSNDIAQLLNWVGYGTFAGVGTGIALFIILPKSKLKNLIIDINPVESKLGYKFKF